MLGFVTWGALPLALTSHHERDPVTLFRSEGVLPFQMSTGGWIDG